MSTISCIYRNLENHPQVLRIDQALNFFERTVFPKQCITFNAPSDALLQIHGGITTVQSDSIPCTELLVLNSDRLRQFHKLELA